MQRAKFLALLVLGRNDRYALTEEGVTLVNGKPSKLPSLERKQFGELVMSHIDCDAAPFLWRYADRFTLFDAFFDTVIGPSTPNAIAMISGQTGETQWMLHPEAATPVPGAGRITGLSVLSDPGPYWGSPLDKGPRPKRPDPEASKNAAPNLTFASLPRSFMGSDIEKTTAADYNPAFDLIDLQADIKKIAAMEPRRPAGLVSAGFSGAAQREGGAREPARREEGVFLAETEVEVALRAWFAREHLKFAPFPFQEEGEMEAAFVTGNYTALAGDLTRLAETRIAFGPLSARYVLLPEEISKDPLDAASRADDLQFAKVVGWTLEVLLQAEESGLTQKNVAAAPANSDASVEILTRRTHEIGSRLGLDDAWAVRVIGAVGNYGEVYKRDLGSQSPLKLPRGLNRLYTDGGLMYALPVK